MHPVGFQPEIPASERPQTDALDRAATGADTHNLRAIKYILTVRIKLHPSREVSKLLLEM